MTDDIRREAERLLAQLRAEFVPPSLGYRFPCTPGVAITLDERIAETEPDKK